MIRPDVDAVFGEWEQDEDGVWTRRAARVIVVDVVRQVLLLRGFDADEPSRDWWFTPGGGVEPGESDQEAALRELFEESGLRMSLDDLVGPVAFRSASFPYFGRSCRQDEVLFFARLTGAPDVNTDGWTAVERSSVTELRWWDLDELEASGETVYPPGLRNLVDTLAAGEWDGITRTIG